MSGRVSSMSILLYFEAYFPCLRDDAIRIRNSVEKYVTFARKHGSQFQYKRALQLHLPTSPFYTVLEGTIPHPSHTYLRMAEFAETEEKERINREIGERRTRLGAKIDQVTLEVKREVFQNTELDTLYRELINWTNDDETRRKYEEKLLQRTYDHLLVLPQGKKHGTKEEVHKLSQDMVIIKHPFILAWMIVLEWENVESLSELDTNILHEFIEFFPEHGLSKVLKGFFDSDISPFPKSEDANNRKGQELGIDSDEVIPEVSASDRLLLMAEGLEQCQASILAHRIMGEIYLSLEEHQTTVTVTRKAVSFIAAAQNQAGVNLQDTLDAVHIVLATALISYQSPRHHPEAKHIFESILDRKQTSSNCLLGIGLILEEDHDYSLAVDFLSKAMQRDSNNLKIQSELYWCQAHSGELESGLFGLEDALGLLRAKKKHNQELKSEILYRIGYCQWKLNPSFEARKDRTKTFASLIESIKANMNYAPAYTLLGIYYADYKKDTKRARRCFHKAFEVSPGELEAAERLARDFADQGDWDIVETVAQRVVNSGWAKPAPGSKRKGRSWPYAALGVVEINRQQYSKSIVHFQSALRIAPDEYESWVGLGESYHHSGRYIAATKAFDQSESLEPNLSPPKRAQVWYAKYMLANVKRELGEFDDAIKRYVEILNLKPDEFGVLIALIQTFTENAWKCLESGLFGAAASNANKAILSGISVAESHPNVFNLWKTIGDAFSVFTFVKGKVSQAPVFEFKSLLEKSVDASVFEPVSDVDSFGLGFASSLCSPDHGDSLSRNQPIYAALLAYKHAVTVTSEDIRAQAVAWYNLGWAEYRAYACEEQLGSSSVPQKSRSFLRASMKCFKRAIELEVGNADFWNALGVVTTYLNPKVAQHSFIRSLNLNERSAQVWTNLATLYLLHNDYNLASEAFTRAQSTDPDFAFAWVGLGFLALLYGDVNEARSLFTHTFELGNAALSLPKKQFSASVFDHLISSSDTTTDVQQLIQPLFALRQLHCLVPSELPYEHMSALFSERVADFEDATNLLDFVSSSLEQKYEESESIAELFKFAQSKVDSARTQLAGLDYTAASDNAEIGISLLDEDGAAIDLDEFKKIRLSAHMTAGLAQYYLKDMDKAIEMFRDALQESESAPEVVCLLAQVLWAKGGDEERSVARDQLFDCVQQHPDHVGAIMLLGVIALLDADDDAIEAVECDLQEQRTSSSISTRDRMAVTTLLAAIAQVRARQSSDSSVSGENAWINEANHSIMLAPSQPQGWATLATATSEAYPAKMALETALRNIPPHGSLNAEDLSKMYAISGKREDVVRAIIVAPWIADGWEELASSISR